MLRVLIAFCLASPLPGADWDRFRGPNGSGVVESGPLPDELSVAKHLLWRIAMPPGHSSPVISGDRVFLTAYEGESLLVLALELRTGKELWRRDAPRARKEKVDSRNSPASPTPASDGRNLFVFFPDYGLLSYGHDGDERWRLPLGPFSNGYGMGASPVLAGENVVLQCDQSAGSFIVAVGRDDGRVRWRHDRPEALSGHSTPTLWERRKGEVEVLAPGSFRMDSYSARTGQPLWFTRGLASEMKSLAIVDRDTVYVSGYNLPENDPGKQIKLPPFEEMLARHDANKDGRLSSEELPDQKLRVFLTYFDLNEDGLLDARDWGVLSTSLTADNGLLAIRPGDARGNVTGRALRRSYRKAIPQLPSVLLYSGVLFMLSDSGVLTTLDPETGRVHQQTRVRGVADKYFSSPVASDRKVFLVSVKGTVTVLGAGPEPAVLAKTELDDEAYATPAIGGGRIVIRTKSALWCFGLAR